MEEEEAVPTPQTEHVKGDAIMEQASTEPMNSDEGTNEDWSLTPGDLLRSLPAEAEQRGTRFVSAQAMQARLFSVYDAAAAAEDALAFVQQQLTLTLSRSYYEADEIKDTAARLDSLLTLETVDLTGADLVSED